MTRHEPKRKHGLPIRVALDIDKAYSIAPTSRMVVPPLLTSKIPTSCEISASIQRVFLFAVLCTTARLEGSGGVTPQPAMAADQTVVLSPVDVSAKPLGCFGISIKAQKDVFSSRVSEMTVIAVVPNSEAERLGLVPSTQILRIDGRDVSEFTATFNQGSELSDKLINRKKGDRISLEVLVPGAKKSRLVTLVEGRGVRDFPYDSDSEYEPPGAIHVSVGH